MRGNLGRLLAVSVGALACILGSAAAAFACPNDAFRTGRASHLPDCRAYELVSPRDKDGVDVVFDTGRMLVAQRESPSSPAAALFTTLGGFGEVVGSGVGFDYLAQRTLEPGTQGWSTHPISPLQQPGSVAGVAAGFRSSLYLPYADPTLSQGLFRANSLLAPAPNVGGLSNLYLRRDLRVPGDGEYQLLTDAAILVTPLPDSIRTLPNVAGTSSDLRHVLFESIYRLTTDAPAGINPKLYLAVDGEVRYAAILPASEGGGPARWAIAAQGTVGAQHQYTPHVISDDGSRFTFVVGERANRNSGSLYLRDTHGTDDTADDTTVHVNASERAVPDSPQPATYWDAAADGSRIFFTSVEALTDDAPAAPAPGGDLPKLYMYDASKPDSDPHNLTFLSADDEPADSPRSVYGTLGVSDDGRTVYWLQSGQIVAGQPVLGGARGIFVWRDGAGVAYVGRLSGTEQDSTQGRDLLTTGFSAYGSPFQRDARVTPDGRYLLVSVGGPLRDGQPAHGKCPRIGAFAFVSVGEKDCRHLYLYDAVAGSEPVCVSCPPTGRQAAGHAFYSFKVGAGGSSNTPMHLNAPMTADGSQVYFTTATALVPEDRNGLNDVYQYRTDDGTVHLISAAGPRDAYFVDVTPDGHDVYIATRDRLSAWDVDDNRDLYDVRVDGGVPDPPPADDESCVGDPCQGLPQAGPAALVAGSSLVRDLPAASERRVRRGRISVRAVARGGRGLIVLRVRTSAAGRVRVSGTGVVARSFAVRRAGWRTLQVRLRPDVRRDVAGGGRVRVRLRVGFKPREGAAAVRRVALTVKAR